MMNYSPTTDELAAFQVQAETNPCYYASMLTTPPLLHCARVAVIEIILICTLTVLLHLLSA